MHHRIATPWKRDLLVAIEDGAIVEAHFTPQRRAETRLRDELARDLRDQVRAYFARRLLRFEVPLAPAGTPFARAVWELVAALSFGEFVSYGDLARAAGRPHAHRGVARAMACTPIALFIPAHRVVGSDGRVRGAAPGSMRAKLVRFERDQA